MSTLASTQVRSVAAETVLPGRGAGDSVFTGATAATVGQQSAALNRFRTEETAEAAAATAAAPATEAEKQALLERLKAAVAGTANKAGDATAKKWYQKPGVWVGIVVVVVAVGVIGYRQGWFGGK